MKNKEVICDILDKAVESGIISAKQKDFYFYRYENGKISLPEIQKEISKLSPSTKQYKQQLFQYDFLKCLGSGGMGEVLAAIHKDTGQKVAIKKIKLSSQSPETKESNKKRFIRECSLQATLKHPNIVRVIDFGAYTGKELFLVTPLIEGETLFSLIERKKQNKQIYYLNIVPYLLNKMSDICDAIYYAHQNGIIHRDINPKNIMIDENEHIWIMDFGLAKTFGTDATKLTKSNEILGTPSYMSPEQWDNIKIGPLSDIYSLGTTLFYIITGTPPHPEEPNLVIYNMINKIMPDSVTTFSKYLPATFDAFIKCAMNYNPGHRYSSAKLLKEALENYLKKWKEKEHDSSFFGKIKKLLK